MDKKYFKNGVLLFVGALSLLLVGCGTTPKVFHGEVTDPDAFRSEVIYVHDHGRHTGISLQAAPVNRHLPDLAKRFPDVRYYEIGWGDAGFYQAEKITSRLTVRAVFWPTDTVIHVVGYQENPLVYFRGSENKAVYLSPEALGFMIQFMASSFARDGKGAFVPTRDGIYGNSQFYRAVGKYYLFNTCNKWTAKALASAGLDVGVAWKITSGSVMRDL